MYTVVDELIKLYWKQNYYRKSKVGKFVIPLDRQCLHLQASKNIQVSTVIIRKIIYSEFVGNKAKGRISKRVFQESKARQNFRKTNISYPLIRFEIRPIALLPTSCSIEQIVEKIPKKIRKSSVTKSVFS